jgi:hypothetical protein
MQSINLEWLVKERRLALHNLRLLKVELGFMSLAGLPMESYETPFLHFPFLKKLDIEALSVLNLEYFKEDEPASIAQIFT